MHEVKFYSRKPNFHRNDFFEGLQNKATLEKTNQNPNLDLTGFLSKNKNLSPENI